MIKGINDQSMDAKSTISGFDDSFIRNRLSDSKLPPLRGTVEEKQSLYNQKSMGSTFLQ